MYQELMKGAYSAWRKNWEISLLPLVWVFVSGIIFVLLLLAVAAASGGTFFITSLFADGGTAILVAAGVGILALAASAIAFMYATSAYQASFYTMADSVMRKKAISIEKAFNKSRPLWEKFFTFTLLQMLLFALALALSALPMLLLIAVQFWAGLPPEVLLFGIPISALIALVAILYLNFLFFFSRPILLYEKGGATSTLIKCKDMLHTKPVHTIMSMGCVWLVSTVFGMIVTVLCIPFYLLAIIISPFQFVASTIQSFLHAILIEPWVAMFQLAAYKKKPR